jgi:hypothetical protein
MTTNCTADKPIDRVCEIHDRLVDFPLRAVSEAAMIERIRISRGLSSETLVQHPRRFDNRHG